MNPDRCTICSEGYFLQNNKCVYDCGNGYYKDVTTYSCPGCSKYCLKCYNQFDCRICDDTHYLINGLCLIDCPAGYEKVNQNCVKCPLSCTNCISSNMDSSILDICTVCDPGHYLYKSKCVKGSCPITTYKTNSTCESI